MSAALREKGVRFRRLHREGIFVMPNAWNAGSAIMLEESGFEAVGTTSAGIAYATQQIPDAELCALFARRRLGKESQ